MLERSEQQLLLLNPDGVNIENSESAKTNPQEERKAVVCLPEKKAVKTAQETRRLFPKTEASKMGNNRDFMAAKALK